MAIPKVKVTVCDPRSGKFYRVTIGSHRLLCALGGQKLLTQINQVGLHFTKLQFSNWLTHGRATEITKEEAESLLPRVRAMGTSDLAYRRARHRLKRGVNHG